MAGRVNTACRIIAAQALWLTACATLHSARPAAPPITITDASRRPGVPVILVVLPVTTETYDVWRGLRDEIGDDYDIVTLLLRRTP
jgi:hypothetical protein